MAIAIKEATTRTGKDDVPSESLLSYLFPRRMEKELILGGNRHERRSVGRPGCNIERCRNWVRFYIARTWEIETSYSDDPYKTLNPLDSASLLVLLAEVWVLPMGLSWIYDRACNMRRAANGELKIGFPTARPIEVQRKLGTKYYE